MKPLLPRLGGVANILVVLSVLFPAASVQSQSPGGEAAGPLSASVKQEPVSTLSVIDTVLAAAGAAAGINATVTTSAEVRAVAISDGPDQDDKALQGDQDTANTPLETDLVADTRPEFGTIALGLNGGDGSYGSSSHMGRALIHLESPLTYTDWRPLPNVNFAAATAKPDSTPQGGVDNATAAVAVGTFHFLGAEQERPFRVSEQSTQTKQDTFIGVSLPEGAVDATQRSTGAVLWSLNAFTLQESGGMVTVIPPVEEVELFHDFVQLSTSPRYRRPYQAENVPGGLAQDLLESQFALTNAERDAAAGTVPLTGDDRVDFTLTGATLLLSPATVDRAGRTDRELIEAYLLSDAVQVAAPSGAQPGYAPVSAVLDLVGGGVPAPDGTLFAENGGFDTYFDELEATGPRRPEDMLGLLVEAQGSLLDAMNLAAQDSSHPLHALLNAKAAGDTIKLDLLFQQSHTVASASENNSQGCLVGGAALEEVFTQVGGEEFAQMATDSAQSLETGVPTVNSNPLLAATTPECITEIQEMAGGVVNVTAKSAEKALACGSNSLGHVVCPTIPAGAPAGECIVLGMVLSSFLPESDPSNSYQFGFVFDSDGDEGNNWVPIPQYANDYFQDTDRWYAVEYTPASGWRLNVTAAGKQLPAGSAARAIIRENTLTLVVPRTEFASPYPVFRLTAFRHSGDYGQNPPYDWSADYHPRLDEPLAAVPGLVPGKTSCLGCGALPEDRANGARLPAGGILIVLLCGMVLLARGAARRTARMKS